MPPTLQTLSLLELNRATLARQHLLRRATMPALEMIDHLVGMQSQLPNPPFTGLWSRVEGFAFDELSQLVLGRKAVRTTVMRGTVHLVTAADALGLPGLMRKLLERQYEGNPIRRGLDLDFDEVRGHARAELAGGHWTAQELGQAIQRHFPGVPPGPLGLAARCSLPLVQIPPRGTWGGVGQPRYALTEDWLGAPEAPYPVEDVLVRYLRAFGPATVKDAQHWSGLKGLGAAAANLGDAVVCLEGPSGEELLDLPDAPRPEAGVPAPPRIIPEWDNVLLGYADRSRMVTAEQRAAMATKNGMNPPVLLVDGVVAATLRVAKPKRVSERAIVEIDPFGPWTRSRETREAVEAEAAALLEAMGGAFAGGDVDLRDFGDPVTTR